MKHSEFGTELGQGDSKTNSHYCIIVHKSGDWSVVRSLQAEIIIAEVHVGEMRQARVTM